jgi:uncharacterized protein (DUF1499 family)
MQALRNFMVGLAVFAAFAVPVWFLVGAFGTKFGLLDWTIGFGLMTFMLGRYVLMGALASALLALGLALAVAPRRGITAAFLAALVPAAGLGWGYYQQLQTAQIPPIHDISTHVFDPPQFSQAVADQRAKLTRGNDVDFANNQVPDDPRFGPAAGKMALDLQRQAYPDIGTLRVEIDPQDAFIAARDAAEALGWTLTKTDPAGGVIEATSTSFWYGFTDDISIRVRAPMSGIGADVDVRSVSRVGMSDLGANAARIRAFRDQLNARVANAATGN